MLPGVCRLFGMSAGPRPASATFWLLDARDSLAVQSRREPDGTGLGWYDEDGTPRVDKQPIAAYEDADFAREARERRSRTFIAHIRFASTGGLEPRNTHPFELDGRVIADIFVPTAAEVKMLREWTAEVRPPISPRRARRPRLAFLRTAAVR